MLLLLDDSFTAEDEELNELAKRFHEGIEENQDKNTFCWNLGLDIFNLFSKRKEVPNRRRIDYIPASQQQVRREVSALMMAHEVDCLRVWTQHCVMLEAIY